jgi:hypothetical protein
MSASTPGPWSTNGCGINAGGRSIAIACPNPKADDGSMRANARLITLSTVIPDLYASEINATIEWFWDGGFEVAIGDDMNGWCSRGNCDTWVEALEWLQDAAIAAWPDSAFAKARAAIAKAAVGLEMALPEEPSDAVIRAVDKAAHEHWPNAKQMAIGMYKVIREAAIAKAPGQ